MYPNINITYFVVWETVTKPIRKMLMKKWQPQMRMSASLFSIDSLTSVLLSLSISQLAAALLVFSKWTKEWNPKIISWLVCVICYLFVIRLLTFLLLAISAYLWPTLQWRKAQLSARHMKYIILFKIVCRVKISR